jgi:hypothetical protein
MKRYLRKIAFFFSPLFAVLLLYVIMDPFKVLRDYEVYYTSGKADYVVLNRGYVSTETFMRQHAREQYDSFIFGNSRSLFWQVRDWKPFLHEGASCFHMDGSDESLYNLHRKVRYMDAQGVRIRHALFVVDFSLLGRAEPQTGHLTATPPRLTGYRNVASFHGAFLLSYLDPHFLLAYYDFTVFGTYRDYMRDHNVLNAEPMTYDVGTNEIRYPQFEEAIAAGTYYAGKRRSLFFERREHTPSSPACLGREHLRLLTEIRDILHRQGSVLHIVISPLYNQRALHSRDLARLEEVFGKESVHDYSGVNAITEDYRNYYELSHYRPHVAARIMRELYAARN